MEISKDNVLKTGQVLETTDFPILESLITEYMHKNVAVKKFFQ
jgi:hypothetical protein